MAAAYECSCPQEAQHRRTGSVFGLWGGWFGTPELGYVRLSELEATRLPVERDLGCRSSGTIGEYAAANRAAGRIVDPSWVGA